MPNYAFATDLSLKSFFEARLALESLDLDPNIFGAAVSAELSAHAQKEHLTAKRVQEPDLHVANFIVSRVAWVHLIINVPLLGQFGTDIIGRKSKALDRDSLPAQKPSGTI